MEDSAAEEALPEPEPEPETLPEPETETETLPEPEPEPEPECEPEPEPEPAPAREPETLPEPEPAQTEQSGQPAAPGQQLVPVPDPEPEPAPKAAGGRVTKKRGGGGRAAPRVAKRAPRLPWPHSLAPMTAYACQQMARFRRGQKRKVPPALPTAPPTASPCTRSYQVPSHRLTPALAAGARSGKGQRRQALA